MRRGLLVSALALVTVAAFAAPAGAARGQVTQLRYRGTYADAQWYAASATGYAETYLTTSTSAQGSQLYVERLVVDQANGVTTGATDTVVSVATGFSLTVDVPGLATARASGTGLPAQACTYDGSFDLLGCSPTTVDLTAGWTGQGPIARSVQFLHSKYAGYSLTLHVTGTQRSALATATFGGTSLGTSDLQFADLGTSATGEAILCIGLHCS